VHHWFERLSKCLKRAFKRRICIGAITPGRCREEVDGCGNIAPAHRVISDLLAGFMARRVA